MPTEPRDIVVEARALLTKCAPSGKITNGADAYLFDMRAPELLRQLCDEVERLRKQVKQMAQDARDDAEGAATEARWQERQGEDYGSY